MARLGYLQVLRHDYFAVLASQAHSRKFEIPARRGEIFMQNRGETVPVAMNRNLQTLYADTRYVYDTPRIVRELKNITGTDYSEILERTEGYTVLEEEVKRETAKKIKDKQLSGIGLSDNFTRVYPEGVLGAQMIGFVNDDGQGQYGAEEALNDTLAGQPGLLDAETDARGIPIAAEENVQRPSRDGQDAVLTIDRNIQAYAEKALKKGVEETGGESGHVVIMDPNSGEVLAMANYPNYDPNQYEDVQDYQLFRNAATSQQFEPGSGFKVFTMAAGLQSGSITPEETYYDSGSVQVADHRIENAMGGNKTRSMTEIITHSVNTGAVYILKQLGGADDSDTGSITEADKQTLYDYYVNRFRLTDPTGIEQPGEPDLTMHKPSEVGPVNYANMAFGQGITTTMTRMVASMSAVINGGTLHAPSMVDYYRSTNGTTRDITPEVIDENVVSEKTSHQVRTMMETVVEEGGGYATRVEGHRIGGKTGTAQMPRPDGGYYNNRDIGTFTGFAPVENPEYIMMVRVDNPQVPGYAGSAAAGPIFGDIIEWLLRYEGVPPTE